MEAALRFLNTLFWIATLIMPFIVGGYALLFNRQFSEKVLRDQERLWHIKFPSWYLPFGRVFLFFLGAGMLIFGVMYAIQELTRSGLLPG